MKMSRIAILAVLTLGLSSCSSGDEPPSSAPPFSPSTEASTVATPVRLVCPDDQTVQSDGGLRASGERISGQTSPMSAAEAWVKEQGGDEVVLSADQSTAWVLRADGTAQARLEVVQVLDGDGWTVQGFKACVSRD